MSQQNTDEKKKELSYGTEKLTQDRLKELAKDPNNVVYEFEVDEDVAKSKPQWDADHVRDLIKAVRQRFIELKDQHEDWADDKIRTRICVEKKEWKQFAKHYKLLFARITDATTTDDHMKHVFYMIWAQKLRETGKLTADQSNSLVQQHMLVAFSTGKQAKEGQYSKFDQPKPS